jgi:hypothetical protein
MKPVARTPAKASAGSHGVGQGANHTEVDLSNWFDRAAREM